MSQTGWTFLTNHAHVALTLAESSELTIRELARVVGITERAVQQILNDLVEADYLERDRVGRRNSYRLKGERPLRHAVESHCRLRDLVSMVYPDRTGPGRESLPGDTP